MKISIIIPCYNVFDYIDDCMNSILNQTIGIENLEIILVDDCSTDDTVSKLKEYEEKYPDNIMLILCEENGRQGSARNIGLSYASGEYISFVDSDDWVRKDMYEILTRIIAETDCDIVQFDYRGKTSYSDEPVISDYSYTLYDVSSENAKRKILLNSNIYNESCWRKIYRRDLLDASGVQYAEKVSYEEPLFTYPLKYFAKKICVSNQKLYYYRYNEAGTTANSMQKPSKILEHLSVQLAVFDFMRNTEYYNIYKEEIDLYFIHTYFCEQFYFLKYRGFTLPVALFKYSSEVLNKELPDWKKNPYLKDPSMKEEMKILSLIDELRNADDEKAQERIIEIQTELKE